MSITKITGEKYDIDGGLIQKVEVVLNDDDNPDYQQSVVDIAEQLLGSKLPSSIRPFCDDNCIFSLVLNNVKVYTD